MTNHINHIPDSDAVDDAIHTARITQAQASDLARPLPLIDAEEDPFNLLEATAAIAGEAGGDDDGSSFVRILRIVETVSPLALAYPRPERPGEELPRLIGEAPDPLGLTPTNTILLAPPARMAPSDPIPPPVSVLKAQAITAWENDPIIQAGGHTLYQYYYGNLLANAEDTGNGPLTVTHFVMNGASHSSNQWVYTDAGWLWISGDGHLWIDTHSAMYWNGSLPTITYFASDGADTYNATLDVTFQAINSQPVTTSHDNIYIDQGTTHIFSKNDFGIADDPAVNDPHDAVGQSGPNNIINVIIESMPNYGHHLLLNGAPVSLNDVISVADINAGKLIYQAPDHAVGNSGMQSFVFRVQDDGGTDNYGMDTSSQQRFTLFLNQTIKGTPGNDTLYGGGGHDVFVWQSGDAGTVTKPAHDTVVYFGMDDPNNPPAAPNQRRGDDKLDLRDLLVGEENSTDLSQYLNFSLIGAHTIIRVSSTGDLAANGSNHDLMITVNNVNLLAGETDQNTIINQLITSGKLLLDGYP